MTPAQEVRTSFPQNSPIRDYFHPEDHNIVTLTNIDLKSNSDPSIMLVMVAQFCGIHSIRFSCCLGSQNPKEIESTAHIIRIVFSMSLNFLFCLMLILLLIFSQ